MVIGMHRRLAAARSSQHFVGAASDYFVDVHVGLSAAPGLPDGERKLVVMLASNHFGCCGFDGVGKLFVQLVLAVHPRRGLFHQRQRVNNPNRHPLMRREGKILYAALGLRAPIGLGGNFDGAKTVGFGAGGHHASFRSP